jgi:lysophospholipase L1-like esterase
MTQIFILGSSSAYGVGDTEGGWGELLKRHYHEEMYSLGGIGQQIEVYNFAKSGATIDFIINNFPSQLKLYSQGGKIICILLAGGNDSKAADAPDNYVTTDEEYTGKLEKLFKLLKELCTHVIAVDHGYVDEAKTNPIINPLIGGKSYFSNSRRRLFGVIQKNLCIDFGFEFIGIPVSESDWYGKYLFEDGLHPNNKGHEYIYNAIVKRLDKMVL